MSSIKFDEKKLQETIARLKDLTRDIIIQPTLSGVSIVSIANSKVPVVLFTTHNETVVLHYVEDQEDRGHYMQCSGDDCILCDIGIYKVNKMLIPVYDVKTRKIGLLSVTESNRPDALLPKIIVGFQKAVQSEKYIKMIIESKRDGRYTTYEASYKILDKVEQSVLNAIDLFNTDVIANEVPLGSIYPVKTRNELLQIPKIRRLAEDLDIVTSDNE